MKQWKVVGAIMLVLILTGCQQSYRQNTVTPVQEDVGHRTSLERNADAELRKPKVTVRKTSASASSLTSLEEMPESVLTEQVKVDQALELCNLAQEMWEQGNLEEALSYLDDAYALILDINSESSLEIGQQKEDIRFLISKRILEIYASRQVVVAGSHDEIPITLNEHVEYEIKRLTGPEKQFFINSLERAGRFRPYILTQLKAAGLPEELSWLPLIESGYQLRALSSARALGLWQFIPSTGYKFGLTIFSATGQPFWPPTTAEKAGC
jgi:membrane-bound lytic murein transglycosylase D